MKIPLNTKTYFEEIGAWPDGSESVGFMYVTGFVLSIILTLAAYLLVVHHVFPSGTALGVVLALAILQFLVQMTCFLHLSRKTSSRDRMIVLGFALLIVTILVWGSLWIMQSLNDRMMPTTAQMEAYMTAQTGI